MTHLAARTLLGGAFALAPAHEASAALTHRYSFTSDATDSVGGANGSLEGNVVISNNAAVFPGVSTDDYIDLPGGLIDGYTSVTFEFWCNVGSNGAGEEIYAFGNQDAGLGANMLMFTPHSGANDFRMSYAQADPGYSDEHVVAGQPILDNQGPRCVVCVYDPPNNRMALYTNGLPAGALSPVTTGAPAFSLTNISNVYSWLGRSLYSADAPYNGTIDEFRIYDAPLSALQALVDDAAGPDRVVVDPGALQSLSVSAANLGSGASEQARLLANFANITGVPVTYYASNWVSSAPAIIAVDSSGKLSAVSASISSATISAMFNGQTGTASVAISALITNLALTPPSAPVVRGSARLFTVIASYSDGTTLDVTGPCSYSSSASNVLSVASTPTGMKVVAFTNGTASLTASCKGKSDAKTISVSAPALTHRYSFNDPPTNPDLTPNTNIVDSVGRANAVLLGNGGALLGTYVFLDGGSADTEHGYVQLPPDLFTNYGAVTFETWVTDDGSLDSAPIFDFGLNTTRYMSLSLPSAYLGFLRGSYTIGGEGAEQVVQMIGRPPANTPVHIVWTSDGAAQMGRLYANGLLVGTNNNLALTPEDIGTTTNNWLGRSQYADPYFAGTIDELRIYNGALDPLTIAINSAAGPDVIPNAGALASLTLTLTNALCAGQAQQAALTGNFANVAAVPMTTCPQVQYSSSNPDVAAVNALGVVVAISPGNATITAAALGKTAAAAIVVNPAAMTHRWSFSDAPGSGTVHDSVGAADGTISGNVVQTGTQAVFDGSAGTFILLPNDLFTNYDSTSFETWFTDNGSGVWARLVDIGNTSARYMYLDAVGPDGQVRAAYNTGSGENNNVITYGSQPATGTEHYMVFTQNGVTHTARLYIDGLKVVENQNFTAKPREVGPTPSSYIGKSQYNDPYFNGSINELRTWIGALTPQQVALNFAAGPDAIGVPATVSLTIVQGIVEGAHSVIISWPANSSTAGYSLQSSPALGAGATWGAVPGTPVIVNNTCQLTVQVTGREAFFRLAQGP